MISKTLVAKITEDDNKLLAASETGTPEKRIKRSKGKRPRKCGKGKLTKTITKKEKTKRAKKIKSTLQAKFNRIKKEANESKKKEKELLKQHIRAKQLAAQLTLLARELQTITKNIQRLHRETKIKPE